MSYTKKVWKDYPETTTPVNAENLNHMEDGIENVDSRVTTLESHTASDIPYGNTNVSAELNTINSNISSINTRINTANTNISTINSSISNINTNIGKCIKAYSSNRTVTFQNGTANLGTLANITHNVVSTSNLVGMYVTKGYKPLEWDITNGNVIVGTKNNVADISTVSLIVWIYYI